MQRETVFTAARRHWHWLIAAGVLAALLAPLVGDRTFASDWGNHLWLIHAQGVAIEKLGLPSYYLQSSLGAFYPYFAFYGGTMYAVLGAISALTSAEAAVVLAFIASLAAAYLGWTWIAFQAGLRGWAMQLPGCLAVTAPYAVTNLYGRGDIPEMIATSMIPLAAAAGLSLLREPRLRLRDAAAFTGSVAVMTGTHTLTLAWGTFFLLLCGAVLAVAALPIGREAARRAWRPVWLGLLAAAFNAWMLAPLILYHDRLQEGGPDPFVLTELTDRFHLFDLFRTGEGVPDVVTADLNTQLPVLLLFWTICFGAVAWASLPRLRKRLLVGVGALFVALLALMMAPSLIDLLPSVLRYIQFPYRLLAFADLALVGLAVIVLAALQRSGLRPGAPAVVLAAIAAVGLWQSIEQNAEVRSWLPDREAAVASTVTPPPTWYAPLHFADASEPVVRPEARGELRVPVESGIADEYALRVPPGPATTIKTNVLAGPYLVRVRGAKPVGRTEEGEMVVALPASGRDREVTFAGGWGAAVTVGRWITLLAIALATALVSWELAGRRSARSGEPAGRRREPSSGHAG